MSPLRQRMVDAMQVRGLSVRTIECYTESISRLWRHYQGVNPAPLSPEQIEAYLLHLVKDRKRDGFADGGSVCRVVLGQRLPERR